MSNDAVWFPILMTLAAFFAGAMASVSGFGIGSLLTPLLAVRVGTRLAVAVVSVPHMTASFVRFWIMRKDVDRKLLRSFGLMSAAGGLTGALLQASVESPAHTVVFGALLIFTGLMGLTGHSDQLRFRNWMAWAAGGVSGLLGGLVGNQGGIRSAAMLGFDMPRHAFVATATAVGLIVDGARMPVYLATQWNDMANQWPVMMTTTAGATLGTLFGKHLLQLIPERIYRRLIALLLIALGTALLANIVHSLTPVGGRP